MGFRIRAAATTALLVAAPLAAQTAPRAGLAAAREAQRRFEVERIRLSPENRDVGSAPCDETVGRMCLTDDGRGDWYPDADEDPAITAARETLLAALDAAASAAPDDDWILGQRVAYLVEAGRAERADSLARAACGDDPAAWWCRALDGLALHALGRFPDAEASFRAAIERMDTTRARAWTDPEPWLDAPARSWWRRLTPAERTARMALVWTLADPLLLAPGNDALTEYWARRTMTRVRDGAQNGYGFPWGSDLEELLLRFGGEIGWERIPPRPLEMGPRNAIGHHDPESRPILPGRAALEDPARAGEAEWTLDPDAARSFYAAPYATAVLPGAGEIYVFPRGSRFAVVGSFALPEDTTYHAKHDHPARSRVAAPWSAAPREAGLFLTPADGQGKTLEARVSGVDHGAVLLDVPAGPWVASVEVFAPELRRAGRAREGLVLTPVPPDVPTLSDLLLVDGALPDGATLENALPRVRSTDRLVAGEPVAIAWELFGSALRGAELSYHLSVEKVGGGVLHRLGRRLGLVGPPPNQRLEWAEEGSDGQGPVLRSVQIDLPEAAPGVYTIRLEISLPGRTPLIRERRVEIQAARSGTSMR